MGIEISPMLAIKPIYFSALPEPPKNSFEKGTVYKPDAFHRAAIVSALYEEPVECNIGKTRVKTLIGAEQIFDAILDVIENAETSIQISSFSLQNVNVDGISSRGASAFPAYRKLQKILELLEEKKEKNPDFIIQIILDANTWREKEGWRFNNELMFQYLRRKNFDVLPYFVLTKTVGGSLHDKIIAADSKRAVIVSGNLNAHTAANHESGIMIETSPQYSRSELDNFMAETFNRNWEFALSELRRLVGTEAKNSVNPSYQEYMKELFPDREYESYRDLPKVQPVRTPGLLVLTSNPESSDKVEYNDIGKYVLSKLDNAAFLRAELHVLCDEGVIKKIMERHQEARQGGRSFDCKIIVSPEVVKKYPYVQRAYDALSQAGVPITLYRVSENIDQQMRSRWAVFDKTELLIGTPIWEGLSLKNNVKGNYWSKDTPSIPDETVYKGNHEVAVCIKQAELAQVFLRQFERDWSYNPFSDA